MAEYRLSRLGSAALVRTRMTDQVAHRDAAHRRDRDDRLLPESVQGVVHLLVS